MVDLYSGLGGASEAFLRSGKWDVLRIESNEELLGDVPNTWFHCVKELTRDGKWLAIEANPDLLWASPPCREFSLAYAAPGPVAHREGREFHPDMSLLVAAITLRGMLQPKYWCIENVVGAIPHFMPYLGPPTQIIGPFVLWHNLPRIAVDYDFRHTKSDQDTWSSNPLRQNLKGKLPLELSTAVMHAAEAPTLEDF